MITGLQSNLLYTINNFLILDAFYTALSIIQYFISATGNWDDAQFDPTDRGTSGAPDPTSTKLVNIESGNTVTILDNVPDFTTIIIKKFASLDTAICRLKTNLKKLLYTKHM